MKKVFLIGISVVGVVCLGAPERCVPMFSVPMGEVDLVAAVTSDTSRCELIRDPDGRHHCRAVLTRKPIYCESIKDSDMRHYCRAVVHNRSIYCESIKGSDTRQLCRALVGKS
jgi:hypothetical protein